MSRIGEFHIKLTGAPMVRNLLREFEGASDGQFEAGLTWYEEAWETCRGIAQETGISHATVIEVMALLSPGTAWDINVRNTREVCQAITQGEICPKVSTYPAMKKAAWRVVCDDATLADVCGGPKVRAFADNIRYHKTSKLVTVDSWVIRAALNTAVRETRESLSKAQYQLISGAVIRAANRVRMQPSAFQAIVWLARRSRG